GRRPAGRPGRPGRAGRLGLRRLGGLARLTVESTAVGGLAGASTRIENYLGFPAGLSGADLAARAALQAAKIGAQLSAPAQAVRLEPREGVTLAHLSEAPRSAPAPSSSPPAPATAACPWTAWASLEGTGVYYAATVEEASWHAGDAVAVVGGGNSAGQ